MEVESKRKGMENDSSVYVAGVYPGDEGFGTGVVRGYSQLGIERPGMPSPVIL